MNWYQKVIQVFKIKELRNSILFVLAMLAIFRVAAAIPLPGIDTSALAQFFASNQLFGLLNIFSGGALSNLSIVMLGVGPYITATIIMQLLSMVFPQIEEMYKEQGEAGRAKFNQISRYLTIPLALLQSFGLIRLFQSQGVIPNLGTFNLITALIVALGGTMFLTWIGELITEKGIGNGVSLIIFAGIIAAIPQGVSQGYIFIQDNPSAIPLAIGFVALAIAVVAAVVFITEGQRNIPVSYAKQVRGNKMYGGVSTYLPMRVNNAGVMPIIFAISIMLFPGMIASFFAGSSVVWISNIANSVNNIFQNQLFYGSLYFILVIAFTYFYTAVSFDPKNISDNLKKQGGFIPGIRPGDDTTSFMRKILNRVTLVGATFLGLIAVLPFIMQSLTGIQALTIGGTGLLIAVSVILESMKQVESQLVMREYDGF
jgi:preprotein translocase subunit SecY